MPQISSSAVDTDFLFNVVADSSKEGGGSKNELGQNFATETVQGEREGALKRAQHFRPDCT